MFFEKIFAKSMKHPRRKPTRAAGSTIKAPSLPVRNPAPCAGPVPSPTHYYVDFENIGPRWSDAIDSVPGKCFVHIFWTKATPQISIAALSEAAGRDVEVTYHGCGEGNNALDFQLSSYVGYQAASNPAAKHYILSNDRGYDVLHAFWKHEGSFVWRKGVADGNKGGGAVFAQSSSARKKPVGLEQRRSDVRFRWRCSFGEVLCIDSSDLDLVVELLIKPACFHGGEAGSGRKHIGNRMGRFHGNLVSRFGQDYGLEIYNALKAGDRLKRILIQDEPYPMR